MYASKRRQRNFKRVREPPKPAAASNPSKRHRERLNGELETVAQLLPYDQTTISRLDKLSVLRLAVSYLQAKAHFHACLTSSAYLNQIPFIFTHAYSYTPSTIPYTNEVPTLTDARTGIPLIDSEERFFETIALKSLGGFLLVLNDNGEIYYASENVELFLGFHQSDILHQPLYDLIHSEDREDIRQQLEPSFNMPSGCTTLQDLVTTDNLHCLERNVNARFRCLLDNTCGFLRIDMRGKLMSLHGLPASYVMGRSQPGAVIGMVAVCTPFVPPNCSDVPAEDMILKTKHQMDLTLVGMDDKVHQMLELEENELPISFYSLIHAEDAICLAEAHKEVIKNGSSGLLIYRLMSVKSKRVYYVQSSCRIFYKNSKPESIGLTHRLLNEVEGNMLLEKRSSLKAKLLSFDDSLLQSPRNLQSTAALTLPLAREDSVETPSDRGYSEPPPLPAVPTRNKKKPRQQPAPLPEEIHLQMQPPKGFDTIWSQLPQGFVPDFPPHFPFPNGFPAEMPPANWQNEWMQQELYAQAAYVNQDISLPMYPPTLFPRSSLPGELIPQMEYQQWNHGNTHELLPMGSHPIIVPELLPMEDPLLKEQIHHYPVHDFHKDYPLPVFPGSHSSNGFNLISEVTNTLLGQ